MIKRRALAADLPPSTCCHTFRATGITAYLSNGGTLEHAQQIAGHASPKTTKLYDGRPTRLTVDEIGFFAVLHTWGQTLVHHPHLHCVIPGVGLADDGTRWVACRPGFFLPVRVLSRYFRRILLAALTCPLDGDAYGCY